MRELELKIKIEMEILSPSLIRFHISTLLLSNSPCMVLRAYFTLSRPFASYPWCPYPCSSARGRAFISAGCPFVFPRQCAVTVFIYYASLGDFGFLFLITLMFPFVNQAKAFGCKSIFGVIFYLFVSSTRIQQLQGTVFGCKSPVQSEHL